MLTASLQSTWGGSSNSQDIGSANSAANMLSQQQQQQLRQQTHSRQKASRYGIPSSNGIDINIRNYLCDDLYCALTSGFCRYPVRRFVCVHDEHAQHGRAERRQVAFFHTERVLPGQ